MKKFNTKKLKNQELIKYIVKHISDLSLNRIFICGEYLAFMANGDLSKKKIHSSNFCGNRFCPMCAWRQSRKDALKISICMKYIEEEYNKKFIFITLTAPNVTEDRLANEITRYNAAFKKMMERKDIKSLNKGYVRKLEITYNKKLDTYHPHFHVIMAVNKSYYSDKTYMKQQKWLDLWREVMNAPEITQVDVRKINKSQENKEVQEIAKYSAKDSDMMISQEVFDIFYNALKGRQVLTYNGLFKDANKLFKQKKLNKYIDSDETEYIYFLLYRWGKGEYVEAEKRELTLDELKKANNCLIDDIELE